MERSRRVFLQSSAAAAIGLPAVAASGAASETKTKPAEKTAAVAENTPQVLEADGRLRLDFGEEQMVLDGGLQPSMFRMKTGAFVVQAQVPDAPFPSKRMHYPWAMKTIVSRDQCQSWTHIPLKPGENGLNLEGGGLQLRDGRIVALDTYVTPGDGADRGVGQLYESNDDWQTVNGPIDVPFDLPEIDFYVSKDDGGRPHDAARLHRRILELPNGDLLATMYGCLKGDNTPCTYRPAMMKSRTLLVRSNDGGASWKLVSTIAVDPAVGTEGFNELVLARVSHGEHAGRLICFMRTGRELYETFSDDEGKTWSKPQPRVFAGLDINRTELWVDMFRHVKGHGGKLLDEQNPDDLKGAVVDPDLIELRSGLLVAAFGVRIPQKACWPNCQHFWNGNYLAFSSDHGETWPNVVRLTSGVITTHYMAIEETATDNEVFVLYDYGSWGRETRYICGRMVSVELRVG
ncbi:MAG: sialidase family protein [Pirellulales bacterium]